MKKFLVLTIILLASSVYTQSIDTVDVVTGWNLIGSVQNGAISQIINTIPPGIIIAPFYGFTPGPGYEPEDTLKRAKGYWVKVSQNGKIILGSSTSFVCGAQVNYSGKTYNTVQIGSQCWLKENLDVGTMIQGSQSATNNGVIEKYCYNNNLNNCNTYGGFYQWNEAMQYTTIAGTQGICPPDWHIPPLTEFQTLAATVGQDGNALKALGQGSGGGTGTNTSGFSALLAGYRYYFGSFHFLGNYTFFWSSTEYSAMYLNYYDSAIDLGSLNKDDGFSVRCIKD